MKHMIKWLKICALLLLVMLILHSLEIVYDIMYHDVKGYLFQKHDDHAPDKLNFYLNKGSVKFTDFEQENNLLINREVDQLGYLS